MYHAIAEFTLAGALMIVGLLTLAKASEPREIPFALLPLFFGMHEFAQGFIWLGMEHLISNRTADMAETYYLFFAKGFLQFWVPFAIWSLEESQWRKGLLLILAAIGGTLSVYALWGLATVPADVHVQDGLLVYHTPHIDAWWLAVGYVLTTCGSLMLSSSIAIQLYGVLNFIGLSIIYGLKPYAFTSLWCLFAASISGLLYFYFVERRISFLRRLKVREYVLTQKLSRELEQLQRRYPSWRNIWQIPKIKS